VSGRLALTVAQAVDVRCTAGQRLGMSRRPKPTKYERIKIDLVVEFKDPHESLRFGGEEDYSLLTAALARAVESVAGEKGVEAVLVPGIQFGLDSRPREADGKLKGPCR
jgi:hypothetical protein